MGQKPPNQSGYPPIPKSVPSPPPPPKSHGIAASEQVLRELAFSPENVVEAATHNPVLFMRAATARIESLHELNRAKMQYKQVYSERALQFREDARVAGERLTEGHLEARLTLDPQVISAQDALNLAEEREEKCRLVLEAFRQRRDMIQSTVYLVKEEMSLGRLAEAGAERLQESRNQLHKKFPGGSA